MIEIALLALLQTAQPDVENTQAEEPAPRVETVSSLHPLPPNQLIHSTRIACGENVVQITGYGGGYPLPQWPIVTLNGDRLAGAERMENDLRGRPSGVFRITGSCPQSWPRNYAVKPDIYVNIVYAQRLENDEVFFQVAGAVIGEGRLLEYEPLSDANFETFWYF